MISIDHAKAHLFDAMITGGIRQVADAAYNVSGFPVIVIDNNSSILARAPKGNVSDILLDALLGCEHVPAEYEALMQDASQGRLPWDKRGTLPLYYKKRGDWFVLSGYVGAENNSVAFIELLLQEEPVSDDIVNLVQAIFNALIRKYHEFAKYDFTSIRAQTLASILRSSGQKNFVADAAQKLQKELPGKYSVAVYKGENTGVGEKEKFIASQINNNIPKVIATEFEGDIVMLSYNLNELQMDMAPGLVEYIRRMNINIGISKVFRGMDEVITSYQQAKLTAQLGKLSKKKQIMTYDDVRLYIGFAPAAFNYDPNVFLHPIAIKLYKCDLAYNTEYVRTMREFLITGKHKKITAERLSIHLNTLSYRLNKIEELIGTGYDDCELMTTLLCNLLMLDIVNSSNNE